MTYRKDIPRSFRPFPSVTCSLTVLGALGALIVPLVAGCSSWGGKINNSEGVNYYSKGEYDKALTAFQTAARLDPDDSEVYYNLASTYQQQALRYQDPALLTQAENNYHRCLEKNPSPETTVCCYRGLATVLNQKRENDQALRILKEWEEKEPNSIEPKLEIAYLLEAQGKNQEAADALTKIKEWAPNDYRAFYKLALVKEKMGDDEEALEEIKTAGRLNPDNEEIARKTAALEAKIKGTTGISPSAGGTESNQTNVTPSSTANPSNGSTIPENSVASSNVAPQSSVTTDPAPSSGILTDSPTTGNGDWSQGEVTQSRPTSGSIPTVSSTKSTGNSPSPVTSAAPLPTDSTLPESDSAGDPLFDDSFSYDSPIDDTLPAETPSSSSGTQTPVSNGIPEELPGELPSELPSELPEEIPDELPGTLPEETSGLSLPMTLTSKENPAEGIRSVSYVAPENPTPEVVPASNGIQWRSAKDVTGNPDHQAVTTSTSLSTSGDSTSISIPDGTGANPFSLSYHGGTRGNGGTVGTTTTGSGSGWVAPTPPAPAGNVTPSAGNGGNSSSTRRSKVGEKNPGPPRTSVGAPF